MKDLLPKTECENLWSLKLYTSRMINISVVLSFQKGYNMILLEFRIVPASLSPIKTVY